MNLDLGPIVKAVKQLQYRIPPAVMKNTAFRPWCRENLQPGWYIDSRPKFMGGGDVLFLNDDQDFDVVVLGWGPEKKDENR